MSKTQNRLLSVLLIMFLMMGTIITLGVDNTYASTALRVTGSKSVNVGKTITLKSNKKVTWSIASGKSNVKLVSKKNKSVKVKGVKEGTAVIKARAGKKVKKVKITVRPKFYSNYIKLKNYIIDNGKYDYELETYEVEGSIDKYEYSLDYDESLNSISLWLYDYNDNGLDTSISIDIALDSSADPMCFIDFVDGKSIIMECEVSANNIHAKNHLKWVVDENDTTLTGRESTIQEFCNTTLDLALVIWDELLMDIEGLSLHDLGFTSYY